MMRVNVDEPDAIWQMLRLGEMDLEDSGDGTDNQARNLSKYNALADPAGAEQLCGGLAALAAHLQPSRILLWQEHPVDLVLAHVVARELGVRWARAYDADGLLELQGDLPGKSSVLLLADAFRDPSSIRALRALVTKANAEVVGIAALVLTSALESESQDTEVISLVRANLSSRA